jgi:hypothetical protein
MNLVDPMTILTTRGKRINERGKEGIQQSKKLKSESSDCLVNLYIEGEKSRIRSRNNSPVIMNPDRTVYDVMTSLALW